MSFYYALSSHNCRFFFYSNYVVVLNTPYTDLILHIFLNYFRASLHFPCQLSVFSFPIWAYQNCLCFKSIPNHNPYRFCSFHTPTITAVSFRFAFHRFYFMNRPLEQFNNILPFPRTYVNYHRCRYLVLHYTQNIFLPKANTTILHLDLRKTLRIRFVVRTISFFLRFFLFFYTLTREFLHTVTLYRIHFRKLIVFWNRPTQPSSHLLNFLLDYFLAFYASLLGLLQCRTLHQLTLTTIAKKTRRTNR